VDDNETNRLILQTQLTAWGMRPSLAADGPSALRQLREAVRNGTPYEIVILDLCMPGMDGLEVANAITADDTLSQTRLMMLSSAGPVDQTAAAAAGVATCVDKPVRLSELHDSLVTLAVPESGEAGAPRPTPVPAAAASVRGRVLVVEDNYVNQMVAEGLLKKLGYDVEIAADGREGLAAMHMGQFDAVLMDCHMPEMDGFAATIAWRQAESPGSRLPIIAMTAGVLAQDRERCFSAGMDDFVAKPVDIDALGRALSNWIASGLGNRASSPAAVANCQSEPARVESFAVDAARLDVLRHIGPDDGWGMLPAVVAAFLAELPQQHAAICDAAIRADRNALAEAAHKLRGSAANLGAIAVAEACGALEAGARFGPVGTDDSALAVLDREVRRAGSALSELVASRQ